MPFKRFLVPIILFALAGAAGAQQVRKGAPEKAPPLAVLSIIPAQGEPGMTVTLSGSGFTERTVAYLGSAALPTRVVSPRVLSVDIPDLAPGLYALFLRREDGTTSKPYNFLLQPQKPVVTGLAPDIVYNCATGREREVVILGRNFQPGSQVMFDGGAIATRFISPDQIAFTTPRVSGGLHQVQVKNAEEALSGTVALFIESRPEIMTVSIGSDFVSYYELHINGRNFMSDTLLLVDGERVGTGRPAVGDRDRLVFLNCEQMVYQRHPYDPTPKAIRLQVQNPNGEASSVVTLSAP